MTAAEQIILENQIALMREKAFDAKTPFMRDQFRERVRVSDNWLRAFLRDERVRRDSAARTRAIVRGDGRRAPR